VNQTHSNKSSASIAVSEPHRCFILHQIERFLPKATVWAFGSRVKGTCRPASDLDLAVHCDKQTALTSLIQLNAVLEESDIPYKVQVLDYNRLPKNMQDNIKQEYAVFYAPSRQTNTLNH